MAMGMTVVILKQSEHILIYFVTFFRYSFLLIILHLRKIRNFGQFDLHRLTSKRDEIDNI